MKEAAERTEPCRCGSVRTLETWPSLGSKRVFLTGGYHIPAFALLKKIPAQTFARKFGQTHFSTEMRDNHVRELNRLLHGDSTFASKRPPG